MHCYATKIHMLKNIVYSALVIENGYMARAGENPFRSSCVEALSFSFLHESKEELLQRCEHFRYRGMIVGPHGSGKTTLLLALRKWLSDTGRETELFSLHDWSRSLDWARVRDAVDRRAVIFIDGGELLRFHQRCRLYALCMKGQGLITTSHMRGILPTLYATATSPELLKVLSEQLFGEPLSGRDLQNLFTKHG